LIYESRDLRLAPNQNAHWRVIIEVQPTPQLAVPVIVRPWEKLIDNRLHLFHEEPT
jgi:hypothetical protein